MIAREDRGHIIVSCETTNNLEHRAPPCTHPPPRRGGVFSSIPSIPLSRGANTGEAAYGSPERTINKTAAPRGRQRSFPPAHLWRPPLAKDGGAFADRLYASVVASAHRHRLRAKGSPKVGPARNPASVYLPLQSVRGR